MKEKEVMLKRTDTKRKEKISKKKKVKRGKHKLAEEKEYKVWE